jgi:hypothetical protein
VDAGRRIARLSLRVQGRSVSNRGRWGVLAILVLGIAYTLIVPELDRGKELFWNQGSHYALVRALANGTAKIDPYLWQSGDVSYYKGHYYSNKDPGLALVSLPPYLVLDAAGAPGKAVTNTGSREKGALRIIWALSVWAVVLPAVLLLLLVRYLAERLEPGLGTAAAVTVGLATLVLPFSTQYFSHILSALFGFAAFVVLWRERERPPDLRLVAAGGVVAGLGVLFEYPAAIVGAVLGLYALSRRPLVPRALAYAAGVVVGVVPLLLYNRWAFGSFTHLSYHNDLSFARDVTSGAKAVAAGSQSDVGVQGRGFFGFEMPSGRRGLDLLLSSRGLLTLTPVVASAAVGTILLYRRQKRAEALTIGGVALAFLLYNSGFVGSVGGWVPGPRYLIPILPFLGVALALAFRRFPGITIGLATVSAITMVVATITQPLLPDDDTGRWAHDLANGTFQDTLFTWLGAGDGWPAIAPFLVLVGLGIVCCMKATGGVLLSRRDLVSGTAALGVWLAVAALAPIGLRITDVSSYGILPLLAGAFILAVLSLLVVTRLGGWSRGEGARSAQQPA